jgi:hypothetical protein
MKPGASALPLASISLSALVDANAPMAEILPLLTATSPCIGAAPEPS